MHTSFPQSSPYWSLKGILKLKQEKKIERKSPPLFFRALPTSNTCENVDNRERTPLKLKDFKREELIMPTSFLWSFTYWFVCCSMP